MENISHGVNPALFSQQREQRAVRREEPSSFELRRLEPPNRSTTEGFRATFSNHASERLKSHRSIWIAKAKGRQAFEHRRHDAKLLGQLPL